MDKTIKHFLKNAPLHTDEDIKDFLEAISLSLHRVGIVENMTASGEVNVDEEQDEATDLEVLDENEENIPPPHSPQFDYPPYYSFYENSGHEY
uniref:Uncharacterized protein n=1 Tax=Globodera rostochiensis TaxID=31243 RepID=A0A914H7Z9_GLORO